MTPRIVEITSSSSDTSSSSSSSDEACEPQALSSSFKTQLASMLSYDSTDHLHSPSPGSPPLSFRHQVPNLLVSSPYTSRAHLLDLDGMDPESRLLALALTSLTPARADYATCAYDLALNWESVFSVLASLAYEARIRWTRQSFYVVEFRSRLKDGADRGRLFDLDKNSHAEAVRSGGLLKYWYGEPDKELANLATCKQRTVFIFVKQSRPQLISCVHPFHASSPRVALALVLTLRFNRCMAQPRRRHPRRPGPVARTSSRGGRQDVRHDQRGRQDSDHRRRGAGLEVRCGDGRGR